MECLVYCVRWFKAVCDLCDFLWLMWPRVTCGLCDYMTSCNLYNLMYVTFCDFLTYVTSVTWFIQPIWLIWPPDLCDLYLWPLWHMWPPDLYDLLWFVWSFDWYDLLWPMWSRSNHCIMCLYRCHIPYTMHQSVSIPHIPIPMPLWHATSFSTHISSHLMPCKRNICIILWGMAVQIERDKQITYPLILGRGDDKPQTHSKKDR